MRKQYKMPNDVRNYVRYELYHYWVNKSDLEELEKDILDESPEPADGQPRDRGKGNPTERKGIKLLELKSTRYILKAEKTIEAIDRAFERLVKEEKEVVELIFKDGKSQIYAQMNKHISKDTYYNTMNKMIFITAKELGLI